MFDDNFPGAGDRNEDLGVLVFEELESRRAQPIRREKEPEPAGCRPAASNAALEAGQEIGRQGGVEVVSDPALALIHALPRRRGPGSRAASGRKVTSARPAGRLAGK